MKKVFSYSRCSDIGVFTIMLSRWLQAHSPKGCFTSQGPKIAKSASGTILTRRWKVKCRKACQVEQTEASLQLANYSSLIKKVFFRIRSTIRTTKNSPACRKRSKLNTLLFAFPYYSFFHISTEIYNSRRHNWIPY